MHELLVTLAIGGSLTTGAVSLGSMVQESEITATANELIAHLNLARSEAITRHVKTTVCPTADQSTCLTPTESHTRWDSGWLVYVDKNDNGRVDNDETVRVQGGKTRANVSIRSSRYRQEVKYQPSGSSGGSTITLAICGEKAKSARYVTVSNTGRARISRNTDSDVRCS